MRLVEFNRSLCSHGFAGDLVYVNPDLVGVVEACRAKEDGRQCGGTKLTFPYFSYYDNTEVCVNLSLQNTINRLKEVGQQAALPERKGEKM